LPASAVDRDACAAQLGAFLGALHAFPPDEARRAGVRDVVGERATADPALGEPPNEMPFARWRAHFRVRWGEMRDALGPRHAARVAAFLEEADPSPSPAPRRLVHYDLGEEHVLVAEDGSRVTGILDWGDVGLGDPAVDFAGLWTWLGRPFVEAALRRYGLPTDAGLPERARACAVFASLSAVWYAVRANRPSHRESGLRGLANCFADA
jgi:aminoglycoside phosphotransferase (APT) family kinase protein